VDYGRAAVRVSDAAGPFVVSSPSAAGIRWAAGGQEGVYWEVANTQLAPVSCETVDILLSVDGGLSYPLLLAAGQPNNGYCVVAVPQLSTATARVMVVCAGSIFFDISDSDFSIEAPDFVLRTQPVAVNSCGQDSLVIALSLESGSGFAGQAGLAVSGLPAGVSAVFAQDSLSAGAATTLSLSGLGAAAAGLYPLLLTGSAGGGSQSAAFSLSLSPALPAAVQPVAPVDGALNARLRPLLAWQAASIFCRKTCPRGRRSTGVCGRATPAARETGALCTGLRRRPYSARRWRRPTCRCPSVPMIRSRCCRPLLWQRRGW